MDRRLIVPGTGVGPAVVGRSTAEEVLGAFGRDCNVRRYTPSDDIFEISYDYASAEAYAPDRPEQATRPARFTFQFGLLQAIKIGVYQSELATREGVRIGMSRADVTTLLGTPSAVLAEIEAEALRYLDLGLEVGVDLDRERVVTITVFRARW